MSGRTPTTTTAAAGGTGASRSPVVDVPFVKYSSNGNSFVIVDEIEGPLVSEAQKSELAAFACDVNFGIGCDNFLVIQRSTAATLDAIAAGRGYWATPPPPEGADLVFRMFEPDGTEACCCGNGLMSIASHLRRTRGIRHARIYTEVPLPSPNALTIGYEDDAELSWVNLGMPRRAPEGFLDPELVRESDGCLDRIAPLTVRFRAHDVAAYTEAREIEVRGHLVFTGEPHLVVFVDDGISEPALAETLFASRHEACDKRVNFGSWLVRRIGSFLNHQLSGAFPRGVNVDFARVDPESETVEYRCFERGIDRETLSCGTGALAVAFVARRLGRLPADDVAVLPYRCRLHRPGASIRVARAASDWRLMARPDALAEGCLSFESTVENSPAVDAGPRTAAAAHAATMPLFASIPRF